VARTLAAVYKVVFDDGSLALDVEDLLEQEGSASAPPRIKSRSDAASADAGTEIVQLNIASPEHAGEPHRGRTTEAEKEYVRTHLDEVNERLAAKGLRPIDPNDPRMRGALRAGRGSVTKTRVTTRCPAAP
jgi:hypothetical protein